MSNWARVVRSGSKGASGAACAAWAKWYVALRTCAAPPVADVYAAKYRPLEPQVSADELDGWLVEAAWRMLGDYNDRTALKHLYVHQLPEDRLRVKLKGVRGPHVRLVVARARNNLSAILKTLDSADTIRSTTCLPGCPVPTAESALPSRRRRFVGSGS